jgi:hypothetical protein
MKSIYQSGLEFLYYGQYIVSIVLTYITYIYHSLSPSAGALQKGWLKRIKGYYGVLFVQRANGPMKSDLIGTGLAVCG